MNVSGVLVRARPERVDGVLAALRGVAGVEIHASERASGAIVVTLEDGDDYEVEQSLHRLSQLDGVADAALIYHYSDDSLSEEAQA